MRLIEIALILGSIAVFVVVNAKEAPPSEEWQIRRGDQTGHVHFRIDRRQGFGHHSSSGRDVAWSRLPGLSAAALDRAGLVQFAYTADAGTLDCQGETRFGRASGSFRFRPNPAFVTELKKLGYSGTPSDSELFSALMHGITLDLARAVAATGIGLSYHDLQQLAIHGVSADYLRDVRALGYAELRPEDFVKAKIHGVDPAFLRELKGAGYQLPMDRMVELKIHGVSAAYLRRLQSAGLRPEAQELIEMKNHGVSPEFLKTLADNGHQKMSTREVIELKIHGVSPEFIRDVRAAGYEFTAPEMTQLRMHGVDGRYLQKLAASGFNRLPADQIVKLKTHGVD